MVKCEICNKELKNAQGLKGHLMMVHNIKAPSGEHSAVSVQHSAPPQEDAELLALKHEVKVAEYQAELARFRAVTEKANDRSNDRFSKIEDELEILREMNLHSVDTALAIAVNYARNKSVKDIDKDITDWAGSFAENMEKVIRDSHQKNH